MKIQVPSGNRALDVFELKIKIKAMNKISLAVLSRFNLFSPH
jgi:hypothetical protein